MIRVPFLLLSLLPGGLPAASLANAPVTSVPVVGCPSDGQQGPRPAPRQGRTPAAVLEVADRVAYYSAGGIGVLAPRGWHCVGLSGSNGTTLIVTPDQHDAATFIDPNIQLDGPGVVLTVRYGGTSGRLAVARMIARHFPGYGSFLRQVETSGPELGEIPGGPHPYDVIRRRGATSFEFTTPAGRVGLGTNGVLAPGNEAVHGLVMLFPEDEMNMIELDMRLSSLFAPLAPAIVRRTRLERGGADAETR